MWTFFSGEARVKRLISLLVVALVIAQCGDGGDRATHADAGEFGLFLTREGVEPTALAALSHIEPADEPLLGPGDIAAYIWDSHAIALTVAGRSKLDALQVPVSGRSFVVCADRRILYAGAFWTFVSSASFAGPTMVLPALSDTVRIQIGYPEREICPCSDPRRTREVQVALAESGLLQ